MHEKGPQLSSTTDPLKLCLKHCLNLCRHLWIAEPTLASDSPPLGRKALGPE